MVDAPTKDNHVDPLTWNIPITDKDGRPTYEFQQKWLQQQRTNGEIPDLPAVPNDPTKFLNGAIPQAYAKVKDSDLAISDIATNNASATKHGFLAKLPNDAAKFLDGTGAFVVPPSGVGAPGSAMDDGTTFYLALIDPDGQLVLDPSNNPIFIAEVLPIAAIPVLDVAHLPASTVIPNWSAQATANQTFAASGIAEKINMTNEIFDTTDNFASSRFTAAVAGYYQINLKFLGDDTVLAASVIGWLYKNGAAYSEFIGSQFSGGGGGQTGILSEVVHLGVGDYVELWGQAAGTAPYARFVSAQLCCRMSGFLIARD